MTYHRMFDVIVVGNGVLGSSAALALAEADPSLRVALVGERHRPDSASAAAGAMHGCFGEVTTSSLSSPYGRLKLAMAVDAMNRWPAWLERINARIPDPAGRVRSRSGTVVIENARSGAMERSNFDAIVEAARMHGAAAELVEPGAIRGFDPCAGAIPCRALFLPNEGSIDSARLLSALELAFSGFQGGTLVSAAVASLRTEAGQTRGVELRGGDVLLAPNVLVATGAQTTRLLESVPDVGSRVPRVFAGVGESLLLRPPHELPEWVVRTPNRSFSSGIHVVPRANSSLFLGATNAIQSAASPASARPANRDFLLECAGAQVHRGLAAAEVDRVQIGSRPVAADGYPLLGATSVAGLWLLTGTYRDGLHLSSLLGPDMAARMLGRPALTEHPFHPERHFIATRTKEQAIDETVRHLAASVAEGSPLSSRSECRDTEESALRARARAIYDRLDCDTVMPIDFVPMIEEDAERAVLHLGAYYRAFEASSV